MLWYTVKAADLENVTSSLQQAVHEEVYDSVVELITRRLESRASWVAVQASCGKR